MDRLFLDANILLAAAYRPRAGLRRLWQLADVELVTSRYASGEAQANLLERAPILPASEVEQQQIEKLDRFLYLRRFVRVIEDPLEAPIPEGIQLPEKDRPILLAAIAAQASGRRRKL